MTARVGALATRERVVAACALATAVVFAYSSAASPGLGLKLGAGLLVSAVAVWRLEAGLVVFVVMTFPEKLPGVLGAGATVAKPLGLVILVAWVVALAGRKGTRLLLADHPALSYALISFAVWSAASTAWADDPRTARSDALRLASVMVLLFVTYSAVRTPTILRRLLWAFLAGAALTAGYSLSMGTYTSGRLSGIFDPNFFAAELVAAISFAGFMLLVAGSTRTRLLLLGLEGLYLTAFVLTQSRGGMIALGVALVLAVVLGGAARARIVVAVLAVAAIGVGYFGGYASSQVRERITNISAQGSAGRADEWRIALRMAADHPALGVGLGNFPVVEPTYATQTVDLLRIGYVVDYRLVTHNTYLQMVSELGVAGGALFLVVVAGTLAVGLGGLRRLAATGHAEAEMLCRGVLVGACGILVAYFFLSAQYEKQLWLLLGLVAAIPAVADAVAAERNDAAGAR